MKYQVKTSYCWYDPKDGTGEYVVKMYFIQNVPYTFDDMIEIAMFDPLTIQQANNNKVYTPEDLYYASSYLIAEQCHPCLFELDVDHPELIPKF